MQYFLNIFISIITHMHRKATGRKPSKGQLRLFQTGSKGLVEKRKETLQSSERIRLVMEKFELELRRYYWRKDKAAVSRRTELEQHTEEIARWIADTVEQAHEDEKMPIREGGWAIRRFNQEKETRESDVAKLRKVIFKGKQKRYRIAITRQVTIHGFIAYNHEVNAVNPPEALQQMERILETPFPKQLPIKKNERSWLGTETG